MNCQGVWLDAGELEQVTQKEGFLGGFTKLFK
jgi:Zn-finger nucleic acid-binding protein